VLDGVSLTIEPGEFVALVGPSGAGKSTLLKLILGLYLPTQGEILINDSPLTKNSRMQWRLNLGVVMQDDNLLSGSLAENISFFAPNADSDRIKNVAKLSQIHDDIEQMPMGYLSLIGDMGSMLSGGQKQRVLLARALYNMPKNLFLDEGTANIDAATEKQIVEIVSKLESTRVVVAHRQAFIDFAEKTIHVENGVAIQL